MSHPGVGGSRTQFDLEFAQMLIVWGKSFELDYTGEPSETNIIYRMARAKGSTEIPQDAYTIEGLLTEVAKTAPRTAQAVRAAHCARGRLRVERWERAQELMGDKIGLRDFLFLAEHGVTLLKLLWIDRVNGKSYRDRINGAGND
jgi:hypothetical protein